MFISDKFFTRSSVRQTFALAIAIFITLGALLPIKAVAQWSANPGDTVRNAFGPAKGLNVPACRGACGADCPSTCEESVQFECAGGDKLLRVQSYNCGTHQGCREHDDCLDSCSQEQAEGYDCATECHAEAVGNWGLDKAGFWAAGGGPYEGDPIRFQYTMEAPGGAEATYRCPDGASRQCSGGVGSCLAGNTLVEPQFESFIGGGPQTVKVSGFRSGIACMANGHPTSICQDSVDINVTGKDRCAQADGAQPCTWYGFELHYDNANPGEPLYCQSSAAKEDFLGGVVASAIEAAPGGVEGDLGKLLGQFQQGLNDGKSLDQIFSGITVTTADGKTLSEPEPTEVFQTAGVPNEIILNGTSGHILVPIFELKDASAPGTSVEHQIICRQAGRPVLETTFSLHFAGS
ncbi:MAG: hypothetical protein V7696_17865 [Halioglobus sp.]